MAEKTEIANIVKTATFSSGADDYIILVLLNESGYEVHATKNGKPVPIVYSVKYDVAYDFQHDRGESAYESLIDLMRKEITGKIRES